MPSLTVFTPTYNRAHTLPRLYASLCAQSCMDFIWLVVDDGSTDATAALVKAWQEEDKGFAIRYAYKENGGMHTAHNLAYALMDTELNTCIDSDDALAPGAVEAILTLWKAAGNRKYAGIVGLNADFSGKIIGKVLPLDRRSTTLSGYYARGGRGDKKLVYRTELMKKYPPYPVFKGERYVGLNYKYLLCDQEYELLICNAVLCNVEYQADGSSRNMLRQYRNNPQGFAFLRKVYMRYEKRPIQLFKQHIHYVSSCMFSGKKGFIADSPQPLCTVLALPLGAALWAYISIKTRK